MESVQPYSEKAICYGTVFTTINNRIQYIPRNMHTVFALLCFVVVIHSLIFPYPSGLLHWHCGNLTIAPVPAKQPWWIWINTSCEFIMNDCITTTKQSTTKPCAYFLGYTVGNRDMMMSSNKNIFRVIGHECEEFTGHHFPDDTFKRISWMKMQEFCLRFHWSLFLRFELTIFQHWFR